MKKTRQNSKDQEDSQSSPSPPWILPVNYERDLRAKAKEQEILLNLKGTMPDQPSTSAAAATAAAATETSEDGDTTTPSGDTPIYPPVFRRTSNTSSTNGRLSGNEDEELVEPSTDYSTRMTHLTKLEEVCTKSPNPDKGAFLGTYKHAYEEIARINKKFDDLETEEFPLMQLKLMTMGLAEVKPTILALRQQAYIGFSPVTKLYEWTEQAHSAYYAAELDRAYCRIREKVLIKQEQLGEQNSSSTTGFKPPKLTIPKFLGVHSDWPRFKANFLNLVAALPAVDKLRMLIDAVRGHDPYDTVADLAITNTNWDIAWQRMLSRYDSPREILHSTIRPLLDFPVLTHQTEAGLHKLISTVRTTQAQLKQISLKTVTEAEALYLHIVMGRLDTKSMSEFNQTLTSSDVPTLASCLEFLERRAKDVALTRELKNGIPTKFQAKPERNDRRPNQNRPPALSMAPASNSRKSVSFGGILKTKSPPPPPRLPKAPPPRAPPTKGIYVKRPSGPCPFCSQSGHRPQTCPKYVEMSIPQKRQAIQKARLCFSCLSSNHTTKNCTSSFRCMICNGTHHTSVHIDGGPAALLTPVATVSAKSKTGGIVPTAKINVHANGRSLSARCLLDTGALGCFITSDLALQLDLRPNNNKQIFAVADGRKMRSSGMVTSGISSIYPGFSTTIQANVLPVLLNSNVPSEGFSSDAWQHLKTCKLADPDFNQPAPIDVIIGLPFLQEILQTGRVDGPPGTPSAYATTLGHIVMGVRPTGSHVAAITRSKEPLEQQVLEEINQNLQKFWSVDSLPNPKASSLLTPEEQFCEDHYIATTQRLKSGHYMIEWPFIKSPETLGASHHLAYKRWLSVEAKLLKNPDHHAEYIKQLQEYLELGHMEEVPENEINATPSYYIPHHGVLKLSSTTTKLRVVFDASAKTSNGVSLNSLMPAGPTIQPDLIRQLLNFRARAVALKSDAEKMYRMIYVHPRQRNLMRILWRPAPHLPIKHYRLTIVAFGVCPAPWAAVRTLKQLAEDDGHLYPLAAAILILNFYVDDLSTSVETVIIAIQLFHEMTKLMAGGGFQMRKWATNSPEVLAQIPPANREEAATLNLDDSQTIKTLGVSWSPSTDAFSFTCNPNMERTHTKRNILSETSKVFDPLGLISPITVKTKILMQQIWKTGGGWDDPLPEEISRSWSQLADSLISLDLHPIPRVLKPSNEGFSELHAFADSSQDAYAAVVYIRNVTNDGITTNIVAAKTRVAPLKPPLTIPRLELQAAVLLVDLVSTIKETLSFPFSRVYYWTDSAIVLHWINALPQKWKLFVRNRVAAIQEASSPSDWAHVPSEENPADCASRGLLPSELKDFTLWWQGPSWLKDASITQPPLPGKPEEEVMEVSSSFSAAVVAPAEIQPTFLQTLTRIGSWSKIHHVLTLLIRVARSRSFCLLEATPNDPYQAEITLTRLVQQEAFPELLHDPAKALMMPQFKSFRPLRPFLDTDGALRVGGRLHLADLPYDTRHPFILPGTHELVRTLIMQTHVQLLHAGKRIILTHLRQRFWIPNGTKHIKSTIDKCLVCFRYHCQPESQRMGQLPSSRVSLVRPFAHTGVDFAYTLRNMAGRGNINYKGWICLFTCMATRAIHLELVSSLSAEGFLNAFRRFISRRGKPTNMYSDNGTNFVGADHHLTDHLQHFRTAFEKTGTSVLGLDLNRIQWSFSPPLGPHHGGAWEICVKLVKQHLRTQLQRATPNWEQLETLLICTEAMVNSRPLTPLDEDPESLEVLTPAHFLIGTSFSAVPEMDLAHLRWNRLSQYQLLTRQYQELWKRWRLEYITELQKMNKWTADKPNLHVGDLVLLLDDAAPPLTWKVGRIKNIHPGADKLVRVVTTEVASGATGSPDDFSVNKKDVVRPITKVARLPLDKETIKPGPGLNLIRPHSRTDVATWLYCGVIMSLLKSSSAQDPNGLPPVASSIIAGLAIIIALLGTILNCLAIKNILWQKKTVGKKNSAFRLCTLSLCLSDLIIAAFLIPLCGSRYLFQEWILGESLCRLYSMSLYGTVTWTLLNLITIAGYRFYKLRHPARHHHDEPSRVAGLLIFLFFISYLFPVMAFTNIWGHIGKKPTDKTACTILPDENGSTPKPIIWILGVFVPFLVIYTASAVVYCRVRQQRQEFLLTTNQAHSMARLRYTMYQVMGTFIIGYQPTLLFNLIDNDKTLLHPALHLSAMFLAWLTTCLHPVVYFFRPQFGKGGSFSSPPRKRFDTNVQPLSTAPPPLQISSPSIYPALPFFINPGYIDVKLPRPPVPPPLPSHPANTASLPSTFRVKSQRDRAIMMMMAIVAVSTTPSTSAIYPSSQVDINAILGNTNIRPTTIPAAIWKLPPCDGFSSPLTPVPPCVSTAHWLGVKPDAQACVHSKGCVNEAVVNDASGCQPSPLTCGRELQPTFIDPLTCQTRRSPAITTPPHILLRDYTPEYCAVGNMHLRNCPEFKEAILPVPVLLVKGVIYPVSELHLGEDALLEDISSYNCSCPKETCLAKTCHGDATFCKNIGCTADLKDNPSVCYCQYTNKQMMHVFTTPGGRITPDCWGQLPMVVRIPKHPLGLIPTCESCTLTCQLTGLELRTPAKIPKYIKASKNPGFVSVIPTTETTAIPFSSHMLISHGPATVEIWLENADAPIVLHQNCPRLSVCSVVNCHICYDRWVNVACYDWINWALIAAAVSVCTIIAVLTRKFTQYLTKGIGILTWPFRFLWRHRRMRKAPTQQARPDEENALPLITRDAPRPYRTTTTSIRRPRIAGFNYHGPFALAFAVLCLIGTVSGCSEFASMSTSSTECRQEADKEICKLQLNTRLAISPVGQRTCFKISNHQQKTLGTLEFETKAIAVVCNKQLLYYVPRPKISCQSYIQCYSLYSSSDCHGDKCLNFKANDTVSALESTKHSLGWSTCVDLRYPTCPWWLTRDCHFVRTAFTNPTQDTYEVFNCPTWKYAVTMETTTRLGNESHSQQITLHVGEIQRAQNLSVSLVSTSLPPTPILSHCLLQREQRIGLAPCNDRGEITVGRIGEIQCDSAEEAATVTSSCKGNQGLITSHIDSMGVKCTGDLVDPELLMTAQPLPLKLENGVISALRNTITFDTAESSLLEIQITATDLVLVAEIQQGNCEASFIKLEGCYSCLSGGVLFIQAKTDARNSITATLECTNNELYTQFIVTNQSRYYHHVVQLTTPDVDLQCQLKCPSNSVPTHIKGHLHYLSNPNFQTHGNVITAHAVTSGSLDFHWISIIGNNIYAWLLRGAIIFCLIFGTLLLIFIGFRWSHPKQA